MNNYVGKETTLPNISEYRTAVLDLIKKKKWDLAITLTFQSNVNGSIARKTARHYWNTVDKSIYGNAAMRYDKRCERMCFIEEGAGGNWHYHIIANTPYRIDQKLYIMRLNMLWEKLNCTGFINDIEPVRNVNGWAMYITKSIWTSDSDAFDIQCSYFTE